MEVPPDFYPSGMTAFAIASTLVCATWTDSTKSRARWPVLVYMSICTIIASICILVWKGPTGLKFFAYCKYYTNVAVSDSLYDVIYRSRWCQLRGTSYDVCVCINTSMVR